MTGILEKVAIIGGGTLGAQIAMQSANAGYWVEVYDVRENALQETLKTVQGIERLVPRDKWPSCLEKIHQVDSLENAVKDAGLVIEAVTENLDTKLDVWTEIGRKAHPDAVLSTNSSSIPISRLEKNSGSPERCLNIHFYIGMNIADVMAGTATSPEVLETGINWVRSLGNIPLTVNKELMGFCFNRVWRSVKREVLYMWANGFVDLRDIDRAWMVFNGMTESPDRFGPFGLMDKVGLDVIYDIEMVYYQDSKDPKDHPPQALKDKIDRGELGVKSGKGFYSYPNPEYLADDFLHPDADKPVE